MLINKENYFCKFKNGKYQILNKESGGIYEVDEYTFEIIKAMANSLTIEDTILNLKKKNIDISKLEIKKIASLLKKNNSILQDDMEKEIFHMQWHITGLCNLNCKHCYQEEYSCDYNIDFDRLVNISDKYFEHVERFGFIPEITITGGEPLTYLQLFDLVDYINSQHKNVRKFLLTNGTLITDEVAEKIRKANFTAVQISLDGYDATTHDFVRGVGNFEKALKGIERLKRRGIYVTTHCVLMDSNIKDIEKMILLCQEVGINRITFSRFVPLGQGKSKVNILSPHKIKEIYEELFRLSKKYKKVTINLSRDLMCLLDENSGSVCPAGKNTITVLNDGSVLPCRRFPIVLGNLVEDNIQTILFKSRTVENLESEYPYGCKECNKKSLCKGGCRGMEFAVYHTIMKNADPQCWINSNSEIIYGEENKAEDMLYNEREGTYIVKGDLIDNLL